MIEIHTNNTHTKFQGNIFVFGCAMAKKTGKGFSRSFFFNKGDDVTSLKCIFFAFLIVVHKNKRHFWNPETNLHKIGIFL